MNREADPTERRVTLHAPYSGYHATRIPPPDPELTAIGPGTPCGAYFRRFWHPVALSSELDELPLVVRILGEDLVLYRDSGGAAGLLGRHCAHRGASLEFGIVEERGLRCCYHGWLYGTDGTVLEAPGEPEGARIAGRLRHLAYPTHEYRGLIFAYFGKPGERPGFPVFDTFELPDNKLVPYAITQPCNWLQVQENAMDPIHAVYLHARVNEVQLSGPWREMPTLEFFACGDSMYYITGRRVGDMVWVRSGEIILPQSGSNGVAMGRCSRGALTSRALASADGTCQSMMSTTMAIGWRHFNETVDPEGIGVAKTSAAADSVDFPGQIGQSRSYEATAA